MEYLKSKKYDSDFINENMMGPNSMKIIEELSQKIPLKSGMRVLDLGCGNGLTSLFLAKEYGLQVFAVDLWISPTENYKRFKKMGLENQIIPIYADALKLPFANDYFDAVISVDAYHYFGNNDRYFDTYLANMLKDNALIAIGIPGMKYEIRDNIPEEMKQYWPKDALEMWHSKKWWEQVLSKSEYFDKVEIEELDCFEEAWNDWLATDNKFAIGDRPMIEADNGRYMNLLSIIGNKK